MKTKIFLLTFLTLTLIRTSIVLAQSDNSLNISISTLAGYPQVTLENSVFKVVIRAGAGGDAGIEHAIRDWIIKPSNNVDIVFDYIDACTQRGPCTLATVTNNGVDEKTVRLNYFYADAFNNYIGTVDYTIYANSPIIKVDYIKSQYSGWANHVDRTTIESGGHLIYGQNEYGPLVYSPNTYWDAGYNGTDPSNGGALNYNDHIVMIYGQSGETGYGFGRIMPIYYNNEPGKTNQSGIRVLKLMSSIRGFETFSATNQGPPPPFTGYLFVFNEGRDEALNFGQEIVNAHVAGNPLPLPVELTTFSAGIKNNSVELNWQTATEINNYGFEIERKLHNNAWENIGFVPGFGNSNSPKSYNFIDQQKPAGEIKYRLKQIDNDGSYEFSNEVNVISNSPNNFSLNQNYPNPFNPMTKISYSLANESQVNLTIYNSLGESVAELINSVETAGSYSVEFNASDIASGTYLYVLSGSSLDTRENFRIVKKMSVIK
jgi:type IX secretion system substrate protein